MDDTGQDLIGGTSPGRRNLLSGNSDFGVFITNRLRFGSDPGELHRDGRERASRPGQSLWRDVARCTADRGRQSLSGGGNVISGNFVYGVFLGRGFQ